MTMSSSGSPSAHHMHAQSPFDILAEELGAVAGRIERENRLHIAAALADLKRVDAERELRLVRLERLAEDRIATIKDGEPGTPGDRGRDGVDGKDVDPEVVKNLIATEVAQLPKPKDGIDGKDASPEVVAEIVKGEIEPVIRERIAAATASLPLPKDGKDADREEVARLIDDCVAKAVGALPLAKDGAPGERGIEGPSGKFDGLEEWARGVHYESQLVTHRGSTYCATRDTAEEPPHGDWTLVAARGADAPVGEIRGLYDEKGVYRKFDLVAFNGSEWRAKQDDPGVLPGDGWALSAKQGKRGDKGDRGDRGEAGREGKQGPAGPTIVERKIQGFTLIDTLSDGTTVACDFRPAFERYHGEAR